MEVLSITLQWELEGKTLPDDGHKPLKSTLESRKLLDFS